MDKILTIIVPTYNMEKYLDKCLTSLIVSDKQMAALEVLVVNDGSKDRSSEIAHGYEQRHPQTFRVIDKENGNYGSCINRGLKEATGKYVKVLDADDYFDSKVLDLFVDFLKKTDADLLINDFRTVDDKGYVIESYLFDLPQDRLFMLKDLPDEMNQWLWHHGLTYKIDIFSHFDYYQTEGVSYSDDEWVFMPMIEVRNIVSFPKILYNYLLGREGQTFDIDVMIRSFNQRIVIGKSMVSFFEKVKDNCSSEARHFMVVKLLKRINVIYYFYLVKAFSSEGNKMLKDFDDYIKNTSIEIYKLLETEKGKFGQSNYIKSWREAGCRNTIFNWLRQMKFKLRIILGQPYRNLHMPDQFQR